MSPQAQQPAAPVHRKRKRVIFCQVQAPSCTNIMGDCEVLQRRDGEKAPYTTRSDFYHGLLRAVLSIDLFERFKAKACGSTFVCEFASFENGDVAGYFGDGLQIVGNHQHDAISLDG